jgi:hypothetical protein
MVSENRNTPVVQQKPHKPIQFTPHQVALMAQLANTLSPDFCKAATPHLSPAFIAVYLETLVSDETPTIPPAFLRALNLKQDGGMFTWIAR